MVSRRNQSLPSSATESMQMGVDILLLRKHIAGNKAGQEVIGPYQPTCADDK